MLLKLVRKTITSRPGCLALGAAAVWYADPDRGRARRAQAQQQVQSALRRKAQEGAGQLRHATHTAQGAAAGAAGGGTYHPQGDTDLREHLRQVVRSMPGSPADVNIDVEAGVATLRGQVTSPAQRAEVLAAVRRVDGVAEVVDLTHEPGQPAPNKADSLRAGG